MPDPITAAIVGGTSMASGAIQSNAASRASGAQVASAQQGLDEQRRQFDISTELLRPYVEAGSPALAGLQSLAGLGGADAQREAISAIEASPEFAALTQQGENALLQTASATGGLRGGNAQAALAQFRPQVLSSLIGQQYERLGGLTSIGQNAAARQGATGIAFGGQAAEQFSNMGAARAGKFIGQGQAWGNALGDIGGTTGYLAGRGISIF
jgi:hypothetical protein